MSGNVFFKLQQAKRDETVISRTTHEFLIYRWMRARVCEHILTLGFRGLQTSSWITACTQGLARDNV